MLIFTKFHFYSVFYVIPMKDRHYYSPWIETSSDAHVVFKAHDVRNCVTRFEARSV